jgi:shikimate kinase
MLPNFVLIGFMGCGKSAVGRRLSGVTGSRFVDTDELVVKAGGCSIPGLFALCGEEGFRDLEERVLGELVGTAGVVVSTGGGAVLRESNREVLKKIGIVIWLDSDPDVLFERAMRSGRRPLLHTEDPRTTFDRLLAARRSVYEATADVRFDSTHVELDDVARGVLEQAMRFHAKRQGSCV